MWVFVLILSNLGQYGGLSSVQVGPFDNEMMCDGARRDWSVYFNEPVRIERMDAKSPEYNVYRSDSVARRWMLAPCVQLSLPPKQALAPSRQAPNTP